MLCNITHRKFSSVRSMVAFKSLIVLDSETTSLPQLDHNTTKITELAFLGCEIEHLKNSKELPRVLHKLVLLFNPKKPLHPEASRLSNLTNELLINVKPFSTEDGDVLQKFIDRLPSPVCIVAHNGDKFDFPILRRTLESVNKKLQNNVYCLDSIKAFRSLIPQEGASKSTNLTDNNRGDKTPPHQKIQPSNSLQYKNVSKEIFPEDKASRDDEEIFILQPSFRFSYKLKDLYYFYYGAHLQDAHRAEEDSKALLSCIMRCKGFLDWMNENARIFNSVEPLH